MADDFSMEEVANDIQRAMSNLVKSQKPVDPRAELINNVYPLMMSLIEATHSRCLETEELVNNLINESETVIQPEEANQFDETLALGEELVAKLETVELSEDVKVLVAKYKESVEKTKELLLDYVIEDGELEDSDSEEDNGE